MLHSQVVDALLEKAKLNKYLIKGEDLTHLLLLYLVSDWIKSYHI